MPDLIAGLIESGRIADVAIALLLVEAVLLLLLRGRGAARSRAGLLVHLAAGGALLLALRAALTGAGPGAIAGWLLAALVAHAADLHLTLRDRR